jgi:hypothetical protein
MSHPDGPPSRIIDCRAEFDEATLLKGVHVLFLWNRAPDWTLEAAIEREPKPIEWLKRGLDF